MQGTEWIEYPHRKVLHTICHTVYYISHGHLPLPRFLTWFQNFAKFGTQKAKRQVNAFSYMSKNNPPQPPFHTKRLSVGSRCKCKQLFTIGNPQLTIIRKRCCKTCLDTLCVYDDENVNENVERLTWNGQQSCGLGLRYTMYTKKSRTRVRALLFH